MPLQGRRNTQCENAVADLERGGGGGEEGVPWGPWNPPISYGTCPLFTIISPVLGSRPSPAIASEICHNINAHACRYST